MGRAFTRDDLNNPVTRRAVKRALLFGDHGVLRWFYDNSHAIDSEDPDRMWRTYQPSPGRLAKWKQRGIRTVINLRGQTPAGHYLLEREACERLGLTLIDFKVYSREAPTAEIVRAAYALFQSIDYPAIMHCKSGADRAGMMAVLYQFFIANKPLDEALEQLSWRYGHVRQGKTGVIDHAFHLYIDHAKKNNIPLDDKEAFLTWIDGNYDPVAIKQSFLSSWWGRLLTEKILRRE